MRGHFGYYNLFDWWAEAFNEMDKKRFKELYKPMGGIFEDLVTGPGGYRESVVWFLTGLAGFATNKSDKYLALKFLGKAESLIDKGTILDKKHFLYYQLIVSHYKLRENPFNYKKAIYYCEKTNCNIRVYKKGVHRKIRG